MAQRMATINNQAMQFAARQAGVAQRSAAAISVTIPVVVHVLYSNASENISDAQIASQIAVLNEDFHKLNADANKAPTAFAGLAADPGIQFVLAKRDPSGLTTPASSARAAPSPAGARPTILRKPALAASMPGRWVSTL